MTPDQFDRWHDFSLRMARSGFPHATPERQSKIVQSVDEFFSDLDRDGEDVAAFVDWDNCPRVEIGGIHTYAPCVGDLVADHLSEHYHVRETAKGRLEPFGNRFENQVSCCIRAGIDLASSPSAGVVGFTVGDLRRLYPDDLPEWVSEAFHPVVTAGTPDDVRIRL